MRGLQIFLYILQLERAEKSENTSQLKLHDRDNDTSRRENVETHVRQVYQILSVWSAEKPDEPGRILRFMEVVTRAEKQCKLKLDESRSDSRPGVTLLDDFLSAARAIRESEAKRMQAAESQNATLGESSEQFSFVEGLGDDLDIPAVQDPLLDWNFLLGLDLSSTAQLDFGTSNSYQDFVQ
jgi:hypothetical protein